MNDPEQLIRMVENQDQDWETAWEKLVSLFPEEELVVFVETHVQWIHAYASLFAGMHPSL